MRVTDQESTPPSLPDRAVVQVGRRWTIKRYRTAEAAAAEAYWYEVVPWAAPRLIRLDGPDLVLPTLPVAADFPSWRPVRALHQLLCDLHDAGIHHRDVHTKNIVMDQDGAPLLIDWETAVEYESNLAYDLYGEDSGVPTPDIHLRAGLAAQHWKSPGQHSIGVAWRCDVPAAVE